jgi:dihydroorotate dehydrogenase
MMQTPFYDPDISYDDNYAGGPFGAFADGEVFLQNQKGAPASSFLGMPVHEPFGIPAGPLLNGAFVKAALDKGFDIPVYKTVRTRQFASHPWPNVLAVEVEGDLTLEKASRPLMTSRVYDEPLSITNSFGVPSKDPDVWQPDMAACVAHARVGQMVVASVEGTRWDGYTDEEYVRDWARAARLAKETGMHAIEANLSCPNEGTNRLLCFDTERSARVARAVKDEIGDTPLILKTALFENDEELAAFVMALSPIVDGFASINTVSAEVVDAQGKQALPDPSGGAGKRKRSGVCGASIKWAGLSMTRRLARLREAAPKPFVIVGVGGVMNAADYDAYRAAGADAVMAATGAMWNPLLAQEIKTRA